MKSLLLTISFAVWSVTFAQPVYFQWSRYAFESSPGNSLQSVEKLTVDTAGNVYFVGEVYPTVAVRARLTRKYSPSGNLIWSQVYNGGGGSETARDICVDKRGNTYVTGRSKVPNMSGAYDLIVIKYDSVGAERWVYRYRGTHQNRSNTGVRLALDESQNNVYVGGWVTNWQDNVDMVVIKVSAAGEQQWVAIYDNGGKKDETIDLQYRFVNGQERIGSSPFFCVNFFGGSHRDPIVNVVVV